MISGSGAASREHNGASTTTPAPICIREARAETRWRSNLGRGLARTRRSSLIPNWICCSSLLLLLLWPHQSSIKTNGAEGRIRAALQLQLHSRQRIGLDAFVRVRERAHEGSHSKGRTAEWKQNGRERLLVRSASLWNNEHESRSSPPRPHKGRRPIELDSRHKWTDGHRNSPGRGNRQRAALRCCPTRLCAPCC